MSEAPKVLEFKGYRLGFKIDGQVCDLIDDLSFSVRARSVLGVVGESGCGKSMTALSVLRLLPSAAVVQGGEILFNGENLLAHSEARMETIRGREISMVFQEPMTSLNPVHSVGRQIGEVLRIHRTDMAPQERREATVALLREVGIANPEQRHDQFPHQLSGGMRQRVMIAMALACSPKILIADEPTTALDVTIQMQILVLLKRRQRETGMAMIFISHDLAAVSGVADEVAVMYAGRIVEQAPVDEFFASRRMPYGEALLRARPMAEASGGQRLEAIGGRPPDLAALPPGCAFAERCKHVQPDCLLMVPPIVIEGGRRYACLHPLSDVPARGVPAELAP